MGTGPFDAEAVGSQIDSVVRDAIPDNVLRGLGSTFEAFVDQLRVSMFLPDALKNDELQLWVLISSFSNSKLIALAVEANEAAKERQRPSENK